MVKIWYVSANTNITTDFDAAVAVIIYRKQKSETLNYHAHISTHFFFSARPKWKATQGISIGEHKKLQMINAITAQYLVISCIKKINFNSNFVLWL